MSINSTNPSVYFGGTWERIAKGRTLVGVDEDDTDFSASSITGGEKTHTLTLDEIPSHNHRATSSLAGWVQSGAPLTWTGSGSGYNVVDGSNQGGGQSHNNLQPFYTCYIWCRIA